VSPTVTNQSAQKQARAAPVTLPFTDGYPCLKSTACRPRAFAPRKPHCQPHSRRWFRARPTCLPKDTSAAPVGRLHPEAANRSNNPPLPKSRRPRQLPKAWSPMRTSPAARIESPFRPLRKRQSGHSPQVAWFDPHEIPGGQGPCQYWYGGRNGRKSCFSPTITPFFGRSRRGRGTTNWVIHSPLSPATTQWLPNDTSALFQKSHDYLSRGLQLAARERWR